MSCTSSNCSGCCTGSTCVPLASQADAQCGKGGAACSACATGNHCNPEGRCFPGTAAITWEIDGGTIGTDYSFEATYTVSQDRVVLFLPHFGRNVQIQVAQATTRGTFTASCPSWPTQGPNLGVITSDNTFGPTVAQLPAVWKNLNFGDCYGPPGDTLQTLSLSGTVSPSRFYGTVDVVVVGAGPRAGTTLRIHGTFDVNPQPM